MVIGMYQSFFSSCSVLLPLDRSEPAVVILISPAAPAVLLLLWSIWASFCYFHLSSCFAAACDQSQAAVLLLVSLRLLCCCLCSIWTSCCYSLSFQLLKLFCCCLCIFLSQRLLLCLPLQLLCRCLWSFWVSCCYSYLWLFCCCLCIFLSQLLLILPLQMLCCPVCDQSEPAVAALTSPAAAILTSPDALLLTLVRLYKLLLFPDASLYLSEMVVDTLTSPAVPAVLPPPLDQSEPAAPAAAASPWISPCGQFCGISWILFCSGDASWPPGRSAAPFTTTNIVEIWSKMLTLCRTSREPRKHWNRTL